MDGSETKSTIKFFLVGVDNMANFPQHFQKVVGCGTEGTYHACERVREWVFFCDKKAFIDVIGRNRYPHSLLSLLLLFHLINSIVGEIYRRSLGNKPGV